MSNPYEWRIDDIERKTNNAAEKHEVNALRERVDSLEYSLRDARSDVVELRAQLSRLQDEVIVTLQRQLEELQS